MPRANRIVIAGKARHCSSGANFIEMSSRLGLSLSFGTVDHSGGRLAVFDPLRDSDTLHSYSRFSLSVQLLTSFHNQIVSPGHSLSVFLWSGPWASPLGGQRVPNRPPDPNQLGSWGRQEIRTTQVNSDLHTCELELSRQHSISPHPSWAQHLFKRSIIEREPKPVSEHQCTISSHQGAC